MTRDLGLRAVLLVLAGLGCSGGEEQVASDGTNPAALRAGCTAEVSLRCGEFQRAEQVECVRREVERCIRGEGP